MVAATAAARTPEGSSGQRPQGQPGERSSHGGAPGRAARGLPHPAGGVAAGKGGGSAKAVRASPGLTLLACLTRLGRGMFPGPVQDTAKVDETGTVEVKRLDSRPPGRRQPDDGREVFAPGEMVGPPR